METVQEEKEEEWARKFNISVHDEPSKQPASPSNIDKNSKKNKNLVSGSNTCVLLSLPALVWCRGQTHDSIIPKDLKKDLRKGLEKDFKKDLKK